jgi:Transposase DDE domain group 1
LPVVPTILKSSQLNGSALRAVVRRVVAHLRHAWPETEILFRGDGHFARPEVMDWIEAQPKVWHITGLSTNKVLQRLAEGLRQKAKRLYDERYPEGGLTSKVVCFGTVQYRARSWSRARRVAVKTEVTPKGLNTRFVVSDLEETSPKMLYQQLYCAADRQRTTSKITSVTCARTRRRATGSRPISFDCFCTRWPTCSSTCCGAISCAAPAMSTPPSIPCV